MNKKLGILSIFTFVVILIISFDVEAAARSTSSSETKSNGTSTKERSLNQSQRNTICKNYLGMGIDIAEYSRKSDYKDGKYTDKVEERTITVKAKKGTGNYLVQVYVAPVGKLEKIENLKEAIKTKASKLNSNDIDDTFGDDPEDADGEVRYFSRNFNTASSESKEVYKLPSGYEALVIMLNNKKKNSGDYGTTGVASQDDKGNPTSWYKYDVTCPRGKLEKENSNSEELDITGNAVSIYSQNPEGDTLVTNYNGSFVPGTACGNAKKGIYDTDYAKSREKYSVANATSDPTWIKMYSKVLGDKYCEQKSVSFNLDNDEIKKISNQLIKSYYYIKKLKQSSTKSYADINKVISDLKNEIDPDKIYTKKKDLGLSLDCNYGKDYKEKNFQTFLFYEEQIEKAKIFNGTVTKKGKAQKTSVDVCKTICYEKLTVSYSPPVATKAGLCFQYKVTVKSKVECGVDADENVILKKMQLRTACNPEPICSNKESSTQGGPNQQFDSCIKECDNGDYSQKCINKCYNKVYKKENENDNQSNKKKLSNKNTNKNINKGSVDTMELNSSMVESSKIVEKVSVNNGYEFASESLETYWKEETATKAKYKKDGKRHTINCSTEQLQNYVRNNNSDKLDICAEYFTQGKILKPKGNYNFESGKFYWETDFDGYSAKETDDNIVKQLGVASPFYLRSKESTKKLITDLVCPKGVDCTSAAEKYGKYRKYSIMGSGSTYTGIKKQYSARFKCNEECHFTGCNQTDALTSSDYTDTIIDDLDEITDKLQKCSSTTACDKGDEKTTEFKIKVKTDLANNDSKEEEKEGTTRSGDPGVLGENTKPVSGEDMFIPADDDNLPGIGRTDYGILGKCYDGHNEGIDYKTTITFPGSWINLKTGDVYYEKQSTDTNREKKHYYCSPYNSKNVNDKWFKWTVYKNSNQNEYPDDFSPTWNITADLGNNSGNKKFGRYNWSIKFQCFYSAYNETFDTGDLKCYKNNSGEETACVDDNGNKIPDGKSTKLQDSYDIRVSDNASIFPQKNGKNRLRGYNWGSQAMLRSKDQTIQNTLESTGYGVDPVKYSRKVMEKGQDVYDDTAEVVITLSQSQMSDLKGEPLEIGTYSNRNYSGEYNNKVENIPGLYYYKMAGEFKNKYSITTNWTLGENSKTAKEAIR